MPDDDALDRVSGGAVFSTHSNEIYNEAGVEVTGSGTFRNDGYRLMAGKEDLSMGCADEAILSCHMKGYPASLFDELKRFNDDRNDSWHWG